MSDELLRQILEELRLTNVLLNDLMAALQESAEESEGEPEMRPAWEDDAQVPAR